MARMYPPRFSGRSDGDAYSAAERVLYKEFAQQLGPDYTVLHSVRWLARDPGQEGKTRDGEADFLILHPRFGVLVVEVKGGTIGRDSLAGRWTSRDAGGEEHE